MTIGCDVKGDVLRECRISKHSMMQKNVNGERGGATA